MSIISANWVNELWPRGEYSFSPSQSGEYFLVILIGFLCLLFMPFALVKGHCAFYGVI